MDNKKITILDKFGFIHTITAPTIGAALAIARDDGIVPVRALIAPAIK